MKISVETSLAALVVALFIVILVLLDATALLSGSSSDPEGEMLQQLNDYRVQNNLAPLLVDPNLTDAAEWKAFDLGINGYFAHNDQNGRTPWTRMCDFGYCHNTFKGENLAAGYGNPEAALVGWINSPGHNANMLGENYRVVGLGYAEVEGSPFFRYYVQNFGGLVVSTPAPTEVPTIVPTVVPTPPAAICPDFNGDGVVNIRDVLTFLPWFSASPPAFDPSHDMDQDGDIDLLDALALKEHFQKSC